MLWGTLTTLQSWMRAELRTNAVHLVREIGSEMPYVVLSPAASPTSRDTQADIDDVAVEVTVIDSELGTAMKLLDRVAEWLRDEPTSRGAADFFIHGGPGALTNVTMIAPKSAFEAEGEEEAYAASATWAFRVEKARRI